MADRVFKRGGLFLIAALLMAAFAAVPASAGTQVVTAEDEHCREVEVGPSAGNICDFTRKVIPYAGRALQTRRSRSC